MDFMTAYATAGHALNLLKELVGIDKAVNAAEFKIKIAELTGAVSDLKVALTEAKDDLASKDAEIDRLKKQFQHKADLIAHGGFNYDKDEHGLPTGNAYCPVCEQKEQMFFHVSQLFNAMNSTCPNCGAAYFCPSFA